MTDTSLLEELLIIERLGWQSLCDGTGSTFYRDLMTDDGLMVLAGAMVFDRDAVAASLNSAPTWDEFELEDVRLVESGPDVVTLSYRGEARREGVDPFIAAMTSTYVRDADTRHGWRLSLYTQTPAGM